MANEEHLALLKQGVEVWNQWRKEHRNVKPDLSGANLADSHLNDVRLSFSHLKKAHFSRAQLHRAYFVQADLSSANLSEALLIEAHLDSANLSGANLRDARLHRAKIRSANLSGADLCGADLSFANLDRANFSHARLDETDLSFAKVRWAMFDYVDLSTAKGLETIIHEGPSLLGLHTLAHSYQHLPETFLKGAGVTETLLEAVRMHENTLGTYPTCLISYASSDQAFVEQLQKDLQAQGVVCEGLPYDQDAATSEYAVELCCVYDQLLHIISEYMASGNKGQDELCARTLYRIQKNGWRKTFRIFLDEIGPIQKQRLIPQSSRSDQDFAHWREQDMYQEAFNRLLRALKGEADY